jgi:D-proline reductase (dithiol) PrdB
VNQDESPRSTPIGAIAERALRLTNDTARGQALAHWLGKTLGGVQLRLLRRSFSDIPWTPLRRPIAESTVALVSTGGVHLRIDPPFDLNGDGSFRVIPRAATAGDLQISHRAYDRRDALQDINLVFPLPRLRELEADGVIGRLAEEHYGFGLAPKPGEVMASGREVGRRLRAAGVDLALLVPA